ncbi:Cytochrome P450 monooxygenase sdnE [Lachnellula suecica]|uniref:Cytochrome P450 monooxygenase sdnE n=1 Tax=Lachnellula suecica TaxID=602035 RepID=A0A8T9CGC1_9HELO|nr:Cytochrome P450 monooxygenase sdnE [Lachnellula suecica]
MAVTIVQVLGTALVVVLLRTVVGAIRRLYFHPISHIPGPKLAALTWWYECYWDLFQESRFVFHIQELHKQYGPIIRITPDEIHVNDVGFLDSVYAPSMSRRDKYPYQLKTLRIPGAIGATANHDLHRKRREALSPFFSRRNVLYLEPVITEKVEQLCRLIARHASEKTPVNLSDALFAFSNEYVSLKVGSSELTGYSVVNNFLFAHQTDVLANEAKAATLRQNGNDLLMGININKHFPWFPDFLESLPLSISKPMMPPGLVDMLALFDCIVLTELQRVRAELVGIMQAKSSGSTSGKQMGPTGKESVYDSVLDSPALPPSEKALLRLEQEGSLLVLAGTESPAKTLNVVFYHLLANPSTLAKLRAELSTTKSSSWAELEKLPYLSAVLEEGNRLSFGVTARTARIAHEPLTYTPSPYSVSAAGGSKSHVIPAGTPISITSLSAHTAATVFPSPYTFDPSRWLGDAGRELRKFQMAFNKGGRKCLGIELARAELYLVTAALVRGFEMELWETGEGDVAFVHDYQVAMPRVGSKGVRVMAREL